jgi:hypothetical protein
MGSFVPNPDVHVAPATGVHSSMAHSTYCLPHHPFPNAGRPNNADTPRIAARSAAACSSAGTKVCMRATVNRARGPAMLITPSAASPSTTRRW